MHTNRRNKTGLRPVSWTAAFNLSFVLAIKTKLCVNIGIRRGISWDKLVELDIIWQPQIIRYSAKIVCFMCSYSLKGNSRFYLHCTKMII